MKSTVPWEWRFPDPRREVTGWAELRERDPELSLTLLEDRAAVVFWRWVAALRAKDPSGLRGLAAAEFPASLRYDDAPPAAQLGAVETIAFKPGQDYDEVHVQVRWESGRRRTDYLIFQRRAGVETKWKAGLSATRCQACGAPAEEAADTVCGYCREPVGWVLARVAPFGEWKRPDEEAGTHVLPGTEFGDAGPALDALSALAVLAFADRAIHDRERAYLRAVAHRRGVPEEKVDEVIEAARKGALEFDPGSDTGMLRGLVRAALADGFVEEGERVLLSRAALRSGVHELELREMIRAEREAMAAKGRELVRRLR
ncbi:MAG: TerB family tellurite resistance protein [Elusimicrobiota bacterium]|nr:MAG: TerB family tellurite resistance protein [Elusimicrobiota bacterium]